MPQQENDASFMNILRMGAVLLINKLNKTPASNI